MSNRFIIFVFAVITLISAVVGEIVTVENCAPNKEKCTIEEVRIDPCAEAASKKPCKLKRGKPAGVAIDYVPHFSSDSITAKATYLDQLLPGMDTDGCKTTKCPVIAGNKQTYTYNLNIARKFPSDTAIAISRYIGQKSLGNLLRKMEQPPFLADTNRGDKEEENKMLNAWSSFFNKQMSNLNIKRLFLFLEVFTVFAAALIYCYYGEELTHRSREISHVAYEVDFVGTDLRFQKSLIMLIRQEQKSLKIKAGSMIEGSMTVVVWILRTSYSVYMMLRTFNTPQ
ncbi:hypothetical protein RN001_002704 [Aquatica leii]|uniref:MD-2-related lipid-recognition domain-containing protein n=1 Tax=Aquatica leii TaxID=1421715 RepID=A0AAN7PHK0_9COLE|nr:hypothetical protein RN001_002704 [Aquatica leii]